ncbi:MAG TPA: iron-containing redox enzyme family protein [Acidimicrobiales bacterium]|nr:iron-containing redox enzyme family protein [Acidimicrobiales bacterium]
MRQRTDPHPGSGVLAPPVPEPRGPLSAYLLEHLPGRPGPLPAPPPCEDDPLTGDDAALALYCCYELHYRPMAGVAEGWEWEPSLLAFRRRLEGGLEQRLRDEVGPVAEPEDVGLALRRVIEDSGGPSLSCYMAEFGTLEQMREFAVHRSAYQLKEADPHTWAIPRLSGGPKAALVHIQFDEYGGGVADEMHSSLFARTMEGLGLSSAYGTYLDLIPGVTLATTNVISLFGLHRRWRGALVGHLAAFEMTSVAPMERYRATLARLGVDVAAHRFYEVHVEADVHHQVVASQALAAGLAATEPALARDILFGARALMLVEGLFARHLLDAWAARRPSLRRPLPSPGPAPAGGGNGAGDGVTRPWR